ncbi:Rhs family protein [Salmonella enterica subsp. enterica]|uniref:Rhs family protein n=1 Tax=Salmonella enterica I TaxID=59201 RepID=A0A379WZ36_SALET|nr:Rhs family protein [Salmonella enterica subsp. enterica]
MTVEHYRFDYDFAAGSTTVTGRQGESWQWWYEQGDVYHRAPDAGRWNVPFTYNEDHFPVNIELPGGRTVAYEYDIQNRGGEDDRSGRPGDADAVER